MQTPTEMPFEQLIEALLDTDTPLHPRFLYRLSDLEGDEMRELRAAWLRIPAWRRLAMMEDIEDLNETDMLLSFEALARFALTDEDPKVRVLAARMLWDYEEPGLIPQFLEMLAKDPSSEARAAAASALGRYIYAGELDEIPAAARRKVEEALLATMRGQDDEEVRRHALEALGFSSREEVPALIEQAYASADKFWKAAALFAMGRSANQQWQPQVMEMLESNLPLLRGEAARAAGELEIRAAVPFLLDLLDDPDEATRQASIWSLSQIGGEGIMERLQRLFENADESEVDFIESALDNLAFNEGVQLIPMFDFPESEEDEDGWYEEIDLDEMDELFDEDAEADDDLNIEEDEDSPV